MDALDKVRKIADGLLELETNTILKSGMTARKMPRPRHALLDIAQDYADTLNYSEAESGQLFANLQTFDKLRSAASDERTSWIQKLHEIDSARPLGAPPDDAQAAVLQHERVQGERRVVLLRRIMRNCDQLKGLLETLGKRGENVEGDFTRQKIEEDNTDDMNLQPDQRVLLRKIWEIGTEEIAIQTVAQIDGDVVTRIQPLYATPEYQALQRMHHDSTEMSLRLWKDLMATFVALFQSLVKGLRAWG
jgi:hypothetical protein